MATIADILIRGNAIFDSVSDTPFRGFVATKGERILAVGKDDDGEAYRDAHTTVIEAGDRLVTAGFHDSHVHLLMAGMFQSYVKLFDARSEDETARTVRDYVAAHPVPEGFVIGFGWYHIFWDTPKLPRKETLDRYFPDTPVLLVNAEAHGVWVNTKALRIAGVTKDTPDPFGGKIERDADGEPTGFFYESACGLVTKYAFDLSWDEQRRLLGIYMASAAQYGITSVSDVMPYFHGNIGDLALYDELDKKGALTVRIHAAPDLLGDLDEVETWREKYHSDRLRVNQLKQFIDGVSTTHTALLVDAYTDAPDSTGTALFDLDAIAKAVPDAHRRGFSVRLHCCGDASLRSALDFCENAIRLHGRNAACRHTVEHCEIIQDSDIPRFGELGVIPSVQPEHMALTQTFSENPYATTLGAARFYKTWPLKSLLRSAGVLAVGSDCPVVDHNPFSEIYRAVTRVHNDGEPAGGFNPDEKLTLAEILKAYTYGSAYAVGREAELGSLTPGKFADVAITDRNLFAVEPARIFDARVDVTIMDGKVVWRRESENAE